MKKIELLAPVGGYLQFVAAVEAGADAVYLGGVSFNARSSANNFSEEELKETIKYAHLRGVKVHLTLNILLHDSEIKEAIEFAKRAYSYGVDAFIVQDLGVVSLIREVIPEATLHFSTQGTIYSLDGVSAVEKFNFERVVLSRELSLDEIENICKNSNTEIEVFVHGALCICYSGQCRLSSLVGGRSGNRGKCAQPCRLKYSLYKEDKKLNSEYVLSPKDLCGVYDLIRLIKSGVSSLKIEGRLKSPEYVACVTSIYRKYIDLAYECIENGNEEKFKVQDEDINKLAQVFNRGGFSKGYYYGESSKELMCYERPKHWGTYLGKVISYNARRKLVEVRLAQKLNMGDGIEIVNESLPGNIVTYIEKNGNQIKEAESGDIVFVGDISGNINKDELIYKISDKQLNLELKSFFDGKFHKKIPINMTLYAHIGKKLVLEVSDDDGNTVELESDFVPEKAINRALDYDNAESALKKLGDTPFSLGRLIVDIGKDALVPMAVLNDARRKAISLLTEKRTTVERTVSNREVNSIKGIKKDRKGKISVYLYDIKNFEGLELADRIYVPIYSYSKDIVNKFSGKEVIPYLSAITKGYDYSKLDYDKILVGNLEHLNIFKNVNEIYCDFSLNVFNSYMCKCLEERYSVKGVNLSFELSVEAIKEIKTNLEKEITVYGRLPLMISEHCVIGSEVAGKSNCNLCQTSQYYLEDRIKEKFPLVTDRKVCRMQVLSSKVLGDSKVLEELRGEVDYFRAYFFDESTEERRRVLEGIKNGNAIGNTSGNFYRNI